jgi:benzoylformate decarboxylase
VKQPTRCTSFIGIDNNLWQSQVERTAAQLNVPCTFVIVRNGVYQALKDYGAYPGAQDLRGMDLPGVDFVALVAGYGVPGLRVNTAAEMADALKVAIGSF